MSLSISARENLYCVVGTIMSLNMASCFFCFFFKRRIRRWMTWGIIGCWTSAAAAHWVRTEEFADDLEKTWTHGGLGWEYPYLGEWTPWCTLFDSFEKSAVWQLDPHATNDKGSQWTLSLITFDDERQWAAREVCSTPWGTSFDSVKKSTVWQLDPHATNDKGSQCVRVASTSSRRSLELLGLVARI